MVPLEFRCDFPKYILNTLILFPSPNCWNTADYWLEIINHYWFNCRLDVWGYLDAAAVILPFFCVGVSIVEPSGWQGPSGSFLRSYVAGPWHLWLWLAWMWYTMLCTGPFGMPSVPIVVLTESPSLSKCYQETTSTQNVALRWAAAWEIFDKLKFTLYYILIKLKLLLEMSFSHLEITASLLKCRKTLTAINNIVFCSLCA